jgi:hypothetical protein
MADDRMKNDDDLQRNMRQGGGEGQNWKEGQGQQTPGRNPQGGRSGQQGGQQGGGQQSGGQQGQKQQGQKEPRNIDDEDEFGGGSAGQGGSMNRGGQNR